jgi:DNA polymerase III epsilon subunit-like protein
LGRNQEQARPRTAESFGMVTMKKECLISVDIESSGPIPGEFSMLSLGACLVFAPERQFTCKVKPINNNANPAALEVIGLSLDHFVEVGLEAPIAMKAFRDWILESSNDATPVFVGLNAPFDWSFINYYFHRYLSENPFGFTALDIKALYMGRNGSTWHDTKSSAMSKALNVEPSGDHDPLHDALFQAELCRAILGHNVDTKSPSKR